MRRRILLAGSVTLAGLVAGGGYAVLTTPERREARLRAELEADMRRERERPVGTRVPGGPAVEGEVYAAIDSALGVIPISSETFYVWATLKDKRMFALVSCVGDRVGAHVAPLRSALACQSVARAFDPASVVETWRHHHDDEWPKLRAFREVSAGFTVQALDALEAGRPNEAADLLCDLWELAHL